MPKIPVYERQFEKEPVSLNAPKQGFDTSLATFGGGDAAAIKTLGGGVADVGTVMLATAARMKKEEDELAVTKAYGDYHNRVSNYLVGDGSPGSGAYGRLGGSAQGLTKEAKEKLREMEREVSAGLTPAQQQVFGLKASALTIESLDGVSRTEAQQRRAALTEGYKGVAKAEHSYALLNFTDPAMVDKALGRMDESARAAAKMSGLDPETTETAVTALKSETLKGVAMRHIENGNFTVVQDILKDSRLTGEDVAAIEKSYSAASDRAKSYSLFQDAMKQDDQLGWLREQDIDPLIRDQAEQRVKAEIQWNKAREREAEADLARSSEDSLVRALEGKDLDSVQRIIEDAPAGLRKEFTAYRDAVLSGKSIEDDPAEKWKWTQMLADDPAKFKEEWNSPAMLAKLSPSTREKFDNAFIAMGKKEAGADPVIDEIVSDSDIIKEAAGTLKMETAPSKMRDTDYEKLGALNRLYTKKVQEAMAANGGKKLTTEQKQKIVDEEILYKGMIKEKGWTGDSWKSVRKFDALYDKDQTFKPDAASDPRRAVYWEAQQQQVNPTLALRVLMAESNATQDATSKKGAKGLMQLMPDTADDLGVDPDDPNENVHGGVKYLRQMLDKYNNDVRLALVAYNWGPGATDKWLRSGADVSSLPEETRNYVLKILKPQG